MSDAVEYYSRDRPAPPFNGGLVHGFDLIRNLPGIFCILLTVSVCLIYHSSLYMPSLSLFIWFLFFGSSFKRFLFQMFLKNWFLRASPDLAIVKLGIGKDACGCFPLTMGFPVFELETIDGIMRDYLVKTSSNKMTCKHWVYFEFKLRGGSNAVVLPADLVGAVYGMMVRQDGVAVIDGPIRVLWQKAGFHVKSSVFSLIGHLAQYAKVKFIMFKDKRRSLFLTR